MKINFENIEDKCRKATNTEEYRSLSSKINIAKKIFILGNGGLHFVSSHMSTDLSRLIPDKSAYSFDSNGYITSNANDHGFEKIFTRWLETIASVEKPEECLVIGLSCSGNSINVVDALHWANDKGMETFMITGQPSEVLSEKIEELSFNCDYFHTVEVATMMLFYDLIHQTDNKCPSIRGEKVRMSNSPLRGKNV